MKRLFVCCDGTWNAPEDRQYGVPVPTNVLKFHNCLAPVDDRDPKQPIAQLRYYHPGVGAGEGLLRRLWDGMTGTGLGENIRSAYKWLADHYAAGDQIFLLGFSRGAFTVRSLGGLIHHCGLPPQPSWDTVAEAFRVYRLPPQPARHQGKAGHLSREPSGVPGSEDPLSRGLGYGRRFRHSPPLRLACLGPPQ